MALKLATGIGCLGAGVILREGINVHGLNTAATLWRSGRFPRHEQSEISAIGMAAEAIQGSRRAFRGASRSCSRDATRASRVRGRDDVIIRLTQTEEPDAGESPTAVLRQCQALDCKGR